ncbi:L-asparagine transporter [Propionibacterium cyclohexanicum]|uniref:L-asparagine transporter n=1 Tax=Propionibacterium cyclohexanicum TaxID=64702 RepID=A0A1H9RFE0_9ACTN|nr:amino acid permease [Propionibacterium cyclohexanicum]SER71438.1 L-asparagine transporter [Propionibacterium cyclohexanicum]
MTTSPPVPHRTQLRRGLKNRNIQMIALGGALGTGLFYGSSDAISVAGPSVLLAYLVSGAVIFLVVRALGEMSVHEPVAGAFSHYAYTYWSPRAGFVSGWNYWFNYIAVSMAELSVVGIYIDYWLPGVPRWATAGFFLVVMTGVNLLGVRAFGEFEFWFAVIKVVAVIGMIILGLVVVVFGITRNPNLPRPSFAHLVSDGGFFPLGARGLLLAVPVVVFAFGGVELIGITAGEAKNPRRTIPRAVNRVIWRILIFYVGALGVIMAVVPWRQITGQMSPFVQIFGTVGVPGAADVLNFVVITAALSVYNSGLYSNGRMLYSLAEQGNAPRWLSRLSRHDIPVAGVLSSSGVTAVAVAVILIWPDFAFTYLMSVAVIAGIINWSMIMITQWKFRNSLTADEAAGLRFRLPGGRCSTVFVLLFFAFVIVLMAQSPGYRPAVIAGPLWVGALALAYQLKRRHQERRAIP